MGPSDGFFKTRKGLLGAAVAEFAIGVVGLATLGAASTVAGGHGTVAAGQTGAISTPGGQSGGHS